MPSVRSGPSPCDALVVILRPTHEGAPHMQQILEMTPALGFNLLDLSYLLRIVQEPASFGPIVGKRVADCSEPTFCHRNFVVGISVASCPLELQRELRSRCSHWPCKNLTWPGPAVRPPEARHTQPIGVGMRRGSVCRSRL